MSWVITPQQKIDPDAAVYLSRVEAADGQVLEAGVSTAVDQFVLGCKSDGIWTAIKASCILSGARTLAGALVPLVGAAPTNFNFVSGDYNRETGLVGNGTTKYLESNRNNNADPQDSKHVSVYLSEKGNDSTVILSAGFPNEPGETGLGWASSMYATVNETGWNPVASITYAGFAAGLFGASRSISSAVAVRGNQTNATLSNNSQSPYNGGIRIYRSSPATTFTSSARLAFYSIGESLDLVLLDARVTTLINAFAAAIP
jgi:hypothetical protein